MNIAAVEAPKERMTWDEIGLELGITAHEAEVAFDRGMAKLRNKLPRHLLTQGLELLQGSKQQERHRCDGHTVSVPRRKAA